MDSLKMFEEDIVDAMLVEGWKALDAPTASEKREAKYTIGEALSLARCEFPDNKQFSEWSSAVFDKIEQKKPSTTNLYRYRQLADFGPLSACELVGFTKVYVLMTDEFELARLEIIQAIENGADKKQVVEIYKLLVLKADITDESFEPFGEGDFDPSGPYDSQKEEPKKEKEKIVGSDVIKQFAKFLDLSEDSTKEEIKSKFATLTKEAHPDNGGTSLLFQVINKQRKLFIEYFGG